MKPILLINPGKVAGGSNLLLARSLLRLQQRQGCPLALVDYTDGATARHWRESGARFDFYPYDPGVRLEIRSAGLVAINLLSAKKLSSAYELPAEARLLAWCTAPQDAFKYLPPAYFLNSASWGKKDWFARMIFPAHRKRIARFLVEGSRRGGVIFMDEHCHEVNGQLFGPGISPAILPLCTGMPTMPPRQKPLGNGKAFWVGRVTDFKTKPLVAMAKALLAAGPSIKEVVVIGDGADLDAAKQSLDGLPVRWRGYVLPQTLDDMLYAEADLVFGHGTALLEAAKLGIPSLLVDGTYDNVSHEQVRCEWLQDCPAGYVGRITSAEQMFGRSPAACLSGYVETPEKTANDSYARWAGCHHPDVIADKLGGFIRQGDYTIRDFQESGAACPGWMGSAMEWAKRSIFRRG